MDTNSYKIFNLEKHPTKDTNDNNVNGELTVKRVWIANGKVFLKPENNDFSPIEITEEMDFDIWGVVTYVIHKV